MVAGAILRYAIIILGVLVIFFPYLSFDVERNTKFLVLIDSEFKGKIEEPLLVKKLGINGLQYEIRYLGTPEGKFDREVEYDSLIVISRDGYPHDYLPVRDMTLLNPADFSKYPVIYKIIYPQSIELSRPATATLILYSPVDMKGTSVFISGVDEPYSVDLYGDKLVPLTVKIEAGYFRRTGYTGITFTLTDIDSGVVFDSRTIEPIISSQSKVYVIGSNQAGVDYVEDSLSMIPGVVVRKKDPGAMLDKMTLAEGDLIVITDLNGASELTIEGLRGYLKGGGSLLFVPDQTITGFEEISAADVRILYDTKTDSEDKRSSEQKGGSGRIFLILLIDTSGSMAGRSIQMARKSAYASATTLGEDDLVSILGFNVRPYVVLSPQKPDRDSISDAVSHLYAAGSTNVYEALRGAGAVAEKVDADIKHIILLSDGITPPADFNSLAREFSEKKIAVSTICFAVDEFDWNLMQHLAKTTKGRSEICWDEEELPAFFTRVTKKLFEEREDKADGSGPHSDRGVYELMIMEEQVFTQGVDLEGLKVPGSVYLELNRKGTALIKHTVSRAPFLAAARVGSGKSFTIALQPAELGNYFRTSDQFAQFFVYLFDYLKTDPLEVRYEIIDTEGTSDKAVIVHDRSIVVEGADLIDEELNLYLPKSDVITLKKGRRSVRLNIPRGNERFDNPEIVSTFARTRPDSMRINLRVPYIFLAIAALIYFIYVWRWNYASSHE